VWHSQQLPDTVNRMKIIILCGLMLFIIGCESKQRIVENTNSGETDTSLPDTVIEKGVTQNKKPDPSGYIYKSELVKIWGDTTIDKSKIHYPEIKFEPFIYFNDFIVDSLFKGQKCPIDYNSNRTAKRFITIITDTYAHTKLNFGGFYTLVAWGCGAPCQECALVDWRDGKVYDGPNAALGFDFRANSRMLIVNSPDSTGFFPDCAYCQPQIWIWEENIKMFKEIKGKN
jgi:hypothetical protein